MLQWARSRSGRSIEDFAKKFPKLREWENGEALPTLNQLEKYANATYTPVGYLFLLEPPDEQLPIPDFRTVANREIRAPSPDLLDTIYACEQRQDWYREYQEAHGAHQLGIVGSASVSDPVIDAAGNLRSILGFGLDRRHEFSTWTDALSGLAEQAEDVGVLVMINGIVGSNTHRKLDPDEFRGFALVDVQAPVVFINGADTKAAQIFTLAHELAHVALGESALSNPSVARAGENEGAERWCNEVAAEMLVPIDSFRQEYERDSPLTDELDRLTRRYKVSSLVVLRRIADAGFIGGPEYQRAFDDELSRVTELARRRSPGGDFYNTTPVRVSKRFARTLISDTLEGRTLHRDAFRLLGFKKFSAFEQLAERLGAT
jgi:Zn-dependent peptidase ImmA (M78 family)/transcriptional regulator with XRE-family HTH domain